MKIKHLFWGILTLVLIKLNYSAYMTLNFPSNEPEIYGGLSIMFFMFEILTFLVVLGAFAEDIGDIWDKYKDKKILSVPKKGADNLKLTELAESKEEYELLLSIEKRLKNE